MANDVRAYRSRILSGPDAFGPEALRPLVGEAQTRRRRWACLSARPPECGFYLLGEAPEPDHLCAEVMAYSTYAEACSWSFDERIGQFLGRGWPLIVGADPYFDQPLKDWALSKGISPLHLPIGLGSMLDALDSAFIGFVLDRTDLEREYEMHMYALMSPLDDRGEWWHFTGSSWSVKTVGPLARNYARIAQIQNQVETWYARVLLGKEHLRKRRPPALFLELEEALGEAKRNARKRAHGAEVRVADVRRELELLGKSVASSTLHDWVNAGWLSLSSDPEEHLGAPR